MLLICVMLRGGKRRRCEHTDDWWQGTPSPILWNCWLPWELCNLKMFARSAMKTETKASLEMRSHQLPQVSSGSLAMLLQMVNLVS